VKRSKYDEPVKPFTVTPPYGEPFTVWAEGYAQACIGAVEHLGIDVKDEEEE
jgi:hypothetical protein